MIGGKHYKFEVKNLVCDAQAKAPIFNIKGPIGYFSCPKCKVKGTKKKVILKGKRKDGKQKTRTSNTYFLGLNERKRKHRHFINLSSGLDEDEFYHSPTILRGLRTLDLVKDVVVDPMHKVYLGCVDKLVDNF